MTITDTQIRKLREEALAASDYRMIDICDRALSADADTTNEEGNEIAFAHWTQEEARLECEHCIDAARAME